jgi:uncharacterized protein with FMN-binding domain
MRRITLWALGTLSSLVLLLGYHTSLAGPMATSAPTSVRSGSFSASATSGSGTSGSGASGSGTARTVTGSVAQTRWGPVEVELSVASDKIAKVDVLQYPNGNGRDQEINDYALPILTQETVDAQSADIDMVSGATVTSDGYLESLQSALDKAGL